MLTLYYCNGDENTIKIQSNINHKLKTLKIEKWKVQQDRTTKCHLQAVPCLLERLILFVTFLLTVTTLSLKGPYPYLLSISPAGLVTSNRLLLLHWCLLGNHFVVKVSKSLIDSVGSTSLPRVIMCQSHLLSGSCLCTVAKVSPFHRPTSFLK